MASTNLKQNVNVKKWHLYLFLVIFVSIIIIFYFVAFSITRQQVIKPIEIKTQSMYSPVESGLTSNGDILFPPQGYAKENCSLVIMSHGNLYCNQPMNFGGQVAYADNNWFVTCGYQYYNSFKPGAAYCENCKIPNGECGKCKYIIFCKE